MEGKKVRIKKLKGYRKKEEGHFIGKVGTIVSVNSAYQAEDMYTVVFDSKPLLYSSFFEHEVSVLKGVLMAKDNFKLEWDKAHENAKKVGLGIIDGVNKVCVEAGNLIFLWPEGEAKGLKDEVVLQRDLMAIEKIYKEKFGKNTDSYEIKLYEQDIGHAIERLIRATEICTLKYVLNKGGALNKCKGCTITKGRKSFLWED